MRILVATRPEDFRKGHDGLAALVQSALKEDPFTHCPAGDLQGKSAERGTVFVFRAKRADRLKILFWDGTGLAPLGTLLRNALPGNEWPASAWRRRPSRGPRSGTA